MPFDIIIDSIVKELDTNLCESSLMKACWKSMDGLLFSSKILLALTHVSHNVSNKAICKYHYYHHLSIVLDKRQKDIILIKQTNYIMIYMYMRADHYYRECIPCTTEYVL